MDAESREEPGGNLRRALPSSFIPDVARLKELAFQPAAPQLAPPVNHGWNLLDCNNLMDTPN